MTLIRVALSRLVVFAVIWWLLTEGAGQWIYGVPVISALTVATLVLNPPVRSRRQSLRVRIRALCGVLSWFLVQSVAGAVDVARRALRRSVDVAPADEIMTVRLKSPVGRVLLADLASLTPGSLAVDLTAADERSGDHLLQLHVLHHEIDVVGKLARLQDLLIDLLDPPDNTQRET